jgi:redox-sensitive bicupin YhaK (pirin superfamily)
MSAGKGIFHAEHNASDAEDVALNQIWITPRTTGGRPRWAQQPFTAEQRHNRLLPVVSGDGAVPGTLAINQDATLYVSNLDAGVTVRHDVGPGRRAYLFVNSGAATVNGHAVNRGDQARIEQEPAVDITATTATELVLIDLP